tara:strand:+ start:198 stop:809 length:612 start_codon:yes stop_codon:yes gene_type:complete
MDYKNGKIYKIVNDTNDNFYIGSTCSTLVRRMYAHRNKHNGCMSKKIGIDLNECIIVLVEKIECKDKDELLRKERFYIEKYKKEGLNIVNKYIPGRTHKEYYEDNKEQFKKRGKEYEEKNKEKVAKRKKEYHQKNKAKRNQRAKENYQKNKEKRAEYYEKNRETIIKKTREKVKCVCGSIIQKTEISRHKKTKKHISYIENEK